jgi:hypothetical protein
MFKTTLAALLMLFPAMASASKTFTIISGIGERSPKQPQVSVDSRGVAHVTFCIGDDVYYCRAGVDEEPALCKKYAPMLFRLSESYPGHVVT